MIGKSQILVGIDVSLKSHHVHVMNEDGETLADFSVSNGRQGADTLIKRMLEKAEKSQVSQFKVGMEATDQYSWHIAHYLQEQLKGYEPGDVRFVLPLGTFETPQQLFPCLLSASLLDQTQAFPHE